MAKNADRVSLECSTIHSGRQANVKPLNQALKLDFPMWETFTENQLGHNFVIVKTYTIWLSQKKKE